jgi:sulfotransferase
MKKYDQFVCLTGLPRTGSTLLSAILSQNPTIHAEGNSAVCQLMWDMHVSCSTTSREQISANNRESSVAELISYIPQIYYNNIDENEKIIVDKCRSWTMPHNISLLKKYIDKNAKIIVLERPILEIVNSFCKLFKKNNIEKNSNDFLNLINKPLMLSLNGVLYAKHNNQENTFLFITYNELVEQPSETIRKIYDFCNWEYFQHDFNTIIPKYKEDDSKYNLIGFHDVRPTIAKSGITSDNTIEKCELPQEVIDKCLFIDNNMNTISDRLQVKKV